MVKGPCFVLSTVLFAFVLTNVLYFCKVVYNTSKRLSEIFLFPSFCFGLFVLFWGYFLVGWFG